MSEQTISDTLNLVVSNIDAALVCIGNNDIDQAMQLKTERYAMVKDVPLADVEKFVEDMKASLPEEGRSEALTDRLFMLTGLVSNLTNPPTTEE